MGLGRQYSRLGVFFGVLVEVSVFWPTGLWPSRRSAH